MKGREIPFVGISPVTTHILKSACKIIIIIAPVASENSKRLGAFLSDEIVTKNSTANATTTAIVASSPSSSPTIAKTKSVCASGRNESYCLPRPIPVPKIPPDPNPSIA